MKKLLGILVLGLLLSGCFKDKSEEAIKNCADTVWSKEMVEEYRPLFYVDKVYTIGLEPKNIFDEMVLLQKKAGFPIKEVRAWAYELKTTEITDTNREIINFFIGEKKKINNWIDEHFKLSLSDRLQRQEYEEIFIRCERVRKNASKTFDAKWQKADIKKVQFR